MSISRYDAMQQKTSMVPFYLIVLYLFLEYARPQEVVPFISKFRLSAITIALLAIALVVSGRIRIGDVQTKIYLLILAFMAIHVPLARNNFWALNIFLAMLMTFVFYSSVVGIVDNEELYRKMVHFWIAIFIYLAIYGMLRKGVGVGGFLEDENDFCLAINIIIPFCLFGFLSSTGKQKIYYLILSCLFLFVIMLTNSRGGFVGLIAVLVYAWFRSKKKMLFGFALALLGLFAVLVAPSTYEDRLKSIVEEGTERGTAADRIYTWKIGWEMFLGHPVFGVGQGNFNYNFRGYEIESGYYEGLYGKSRAGRAAHSIYFTLLPELGIVGVMLFFGMVIFNFKDLRLIRKLTKNRTGTGNKDPGFDYYNMSLAIECSMIAFLVSGAFISALYYPHLWIITGMILALKHVLVSKNGGTPVPQPAGRYSKK